MRNAKKAVIYGFVTWMIPFVVAMLIFPFHENERALFESIMAVTVTFSVVLFTYLYFKEVKRNFVNKAVKVGLVWLGISVAIDLLMFMQGPMKMSFVEYMEDIGITYLIIPIITIGVGYLLEKT